MKYLRYLLLACIVALTSCGKSKHEQDRNTMSGDSANAALKQMIDDKHMDVMSKMDPIYALKKRLMDTVAHTKGLVAAKKAELEKLIQSLDSANASMMDWMHTFNPNKDSADQEKNRAYLESEIEQINKIGEQINEVLEKSREAMKR
jgi:hypothetical protein